MSAVAVAQSTPISVSELASSLAGNNELRQKLSEDLQSGLLSFISGANEASNLASAVLDALQDSSGGISKARALVAPYRERFWETFRSRSSGIFENIRPVFGEMLQASAGDRPLKCFDWGTGKGRFPGMIQGAFPRWTVSGGDVLDYRDATDFPFYRIEANRVPQLESGSQDAALISYVLHHEAKPDEIVAELQRILAPGGRAVVIELCPQGDSEAALELDRKRVLFSDLVYCVVWQDENIPMPGTYKSPDAWRSLFQKNGFHLVRDTPIQGTPLIYGDRHLMVFEKVHANDTAQLDMANLTVPSKG